MVSLKLSPLSLCHMSAFDMSGNSKQLWFSHYYDMECSDWFIF